MSLEPQSANICSFFAQKVEKVRQHQRLKAKYLWLNRHVFRYLYDNGGSAPMRGFASHFKKLIILVQVLSLSLCSQRGHTASENADPAENPKHMIATTSPIKVGNDTTYIAEESFEIDSQDSLAAAGG